ncbi:hypothetical protein BDV93DRAFT_441154 [Ceratobasidium sp. AG-I]|nr:hypothetical protein BDV93DRAFT_441154 [Ceratobasidium sp. AG-I]
MFIRLQRLTTLVCIVLASSAFSVSPNSQVTLQKVQAQDRAWETPPSSDSSDNLIFFRLATLLQHWPNTRYPLGQSVVLGTIPIGTTLYHGRPNPNIPSAPDWLSFDPESSVLFMRGTTTSRLMTFSTIRKLRVLYFDGASAAKLTTGSLDTHEMLIGFGRATGNITVDDSKRIAGLCEWGKDKNIDGYIRMEMNFELMLCDFTRNLDLVSSVHVLPTNATHVRIPQEPRPPSWQGSLPLSASRGFEVFQAAAWHGRAPGEVRIRLDAARLVSTYDPDLPSGIIARRGVEKILHRARGLDTNDIRKWQAWIARAASLDAPETSGVDWQALSTVIMDRYGSRLEYLQLLLQPGQVFSNTTAVLAVRDQLMLMLLTDLTPDTIPDDKIHGSHSWVRPVAEHCSSYLLSRLPLAEFTREERVLFDAISGTQREICRVLALMWSKAYIVPPSVNEDMILNEWRNEVSTLMKWLDWPIWHRCIPECDLEASKLIHMCFIPTWPIGIGKSPIPGRPGGEEDPSKVDWTPKCVPRGQSLL